MAGDGEDVSLFIGGTNDGKRMDVPDLPIVRLMRRDSQGVGTESYRMERIETQRSVFKFYVACEMSLDDGLLKLFSGYNRDVIVDCRNSA